MVKNENLFYTLGSLLFFIMILNIFGVLAPKTEKTEQKEKTESVSLVPSSYFYPYRWNNYLPFGYNTVYLPPYRKNIVYSPDIYVKPGPYYRRHGRRMRRRNRR